MSLVGTFIFAIFILIKPNEVSAAPTVEQIATELSQRLSAKDEEFTATMKIIEADGSNKEREMTVLRLSKEKNDHSLLVRMQRPQDLKGTALLATLKGEKEDRWLYLPSSKQTRRLSGESGQGGILGSELNTEDFDFNRDQKAKSNLKNEMSVDGKKYYILESDVNETSSNYSRVISFISAKEFLPMKFECYDKKGKLLKILNISSYKKVTSTKWRAEKIIIKNVQNNRGTEIVIKGVKINQNLKSSRFTPKMLAED
jgi:outer membrane lipoprotein-sorting protein